MQNAPFCILARSLESPQESGPSKNALFNVPFCAFSYPEPFLRAFDRARRGALAKTITGYHKNMVREQYPVLELWPIRCQFDMDLARAPRRARSNACKKGSGYENAFCGDKVLTEAG
jgi:hypothetical protein